MKKKRRKAFWHNIKFKYKLTVTNENTLGEVVVTGHREYRSDRSAIETVKNAGNYILNYHSAIELQLIYQKLVI